MRSKYSRDKRQRHRARSIERLEDRQVMSADPLSGMLGGAISHHDLQDAPPLVHHALQDAPSLAQPAARDADFWVDTWSERDVDSLVGDIEQTLASAHGSTGLTGVRNDYGFIGTGQTVAIIDSGIAWNHPALGNGFGANYRVVGGWDFTENDSDPYDDGPEGSHGTHVSGIVGGDRSGTNDDGVAPGVDLVGLRVFDDSGNGYFSWVESALQWVHQNRNAFENPITAVNLSLGVSWNSDTVPNWTTIEDEFAQLEADGIFIAVSAGNSFASYNAPGLSYPAASPYVVPVMAATDSGGLASFSQRHTRAIAAPGQYIVSSVPDYAGNNNGVNDDYASFSGTSMAAPYVAGASVLLREAMQFVGYTNITQDTIYDHMMNTATSFLDAATGQTYKRLNLTSAFNALMPTDEYGSTTDTAYNLGALSGASEISGLIGKLSDADYFSFTATGNGTVSFTATTTHGLVPVWSASGGTVSGANGETYTFDVTAGQSYTIGLSTSGGIGFYDLAIDAESAFSYVDWGSVTQSQTNNVANSGESWYRVTASRTGFLTAEALFAAAGGNVDIALYNSNLQLVASGTAGAAGERVDFQATAGADYYLCVTGTNADVDFRLTNLVSQSGATVDVAGTVDADVFTFAVGVAQHTLGVNGVNYNFDRSEVTTINFDGAGGNDSITMNGSSGDETATLYAGSAQLAGSDYAASSASVESAIIHGGGGTDVAHLYDTAGNDTFSSWWNRALLYGSGFSNDVRGFDNVYGYASQGKDRATLRDTNGDDVYTTWWNRAIMYGEGYWCEARGFDSSLGLASEGNDRAMLRDCAGDDIYKAWSDRALMTGVGFSHDARSFDKAYGLASSGYDQAYLYDSTGDDVYTAWFDRAIMAGNGFTNEARTFDRVYGYASTGNDQAFFYDTAGDDTYTSWWNRAIMYGDGYWNEARGFDFTKAFATQGNDRAVLRDSSAHDEVHGSGAIAYMMGTAYRNEAEGFDRVDVCDTDGDNSDMAFISATDYFFNILGNWTAG
jgi:subtilisin family serine protease